MAHIVELHKMSNKELKDLLEEDHKEQFNLRFQKAQNALKNSARLTQVRREIAQINELLHKRELAIGLARKQDEVVSALKDKTWEATASFDYETGGWVVKFVEGTKELATAVVDLNKKRRATRRTRATKPPVKKVVSVKVA